MFIVMVMVIFCWFVFCELFWMLVWGICYCYLEIYLWLIEVLWFWVWFFGFFVEEVKEIVDNRN